MAGPADDPAGEWAQMRGIRPRVYVCRRASGAPPFDGKLDTGAWAQAQWTEDFVDIEGSPKPAPRFRTRAKMLWDDRCIYFAAEIQEPHVVATLTEKNAIIYNDNDFEIFLDPDGDHHNYYEFEMNALNTIWELTLPRPYKDGGQPKLGTNIDGLRSTTHVRGTINDPRDIDEGWSAEVAIPWKGLATYNPGRPTPPREGDCWRVNFSRVQWRYDVVGGKYVRHDRARSPEDNWVWSPQGIVDMHRPERWGFVFFTDKATRLDEAEAASLDREIAARDALMEVYHRQRVFRTRSNRWATSLAELHIDSTCVVLESRGETYEASTSFSAGDGTSRKLRVGPDSRLTAEATGGSEKR